MKITSRKLRRLIETSGPNKIWFQILIFSFPIDIGTQRKPAHVAHGDPQYTLTAWRHHSIV
jgi:hypothetical protein